MNVRGRLADRYRAIVAYSGVIFLLGGLLMLVPVLALVGWPAEALGCLAFALPGLGLCGVGVGLWRTYRPPQGASLTAQEGGVVVLVSWVGICLVSACPFLFVQGLTFTQALFESVSGWTTTGLSVVDVTEAPHTILLWRSIMQFGGGAGLAIIMLAAITGPPGPGLYSAERTEQLVPHVRRSANLVLRIYCGYALVGAVAYCMAGMDFFDAINHSFTAVSTGGFSTRAESIGHWDSMRIEMVTLPLMLLGSLNFLTAYLLLHGRWRAARRSGELKLAAVLACVGLVVLLCSTGALYPSVGKRARVAVFEMVSALTTTGFSTVSYAHWGTLAFLVILGLMMIGGGTCSTAGGIKQYRIYVLLKSIVWHIRRSFLPRGAVVENYVWQGERRDFIDDARIRQIATFVFLYLVTYFLGAGVLAAHGHTLRDALFEFASAQGTVGLSIGVTGPDAPASVLWAEIVGMFLGRLEFFVIFVAAGKVVRDAALWRASRTQGTD